MSTKFPEEEYKKLHQRVCKILYSQLTSSAPAQDATKLLEKLDASTATKQELLDALDKKLQRFQDPVGWIRDKREGLEQICRKIEQRRVNDPGFEAHLSQGGRTGLQIIFHVVRSDPSTLSVTSDDINKISVCMQELKNILPGSSVQPPSTTHHPHPQQQQYAPVQHHSLPPVSAHHQIPSHIPQHLSSHMNHFQTAPPPQMMSSMPSYHHQQNFNPTMMSHHPVVPQHSYPLPPIQHHYPVQPIQSNPVVPVNPHPVHPPASSTHKPSTPAPSAPLMSSQSSSSSNNGSALSSSSSSSSSSSTSSASSFDDGIYGIIVIELQYLLKKCMEKPSKIKVQEITGNLLFFLFYLDSFMTFLFSLLSSLLSSPFSFRKVL
jgi:hypothetical protein